MFKTLSEDSPTVVSNIFVFVALNERNECIGPTIVQVFDSREPIYRLGAISEKTVEKSSNIFLSLFGVSG
jgi:hypothetical protein